VAGTDVTSKKIVLDVNAEDERGRHFTIEMQVKPGDFYVERVVFYGAKLHTDQLPSGSVYRQLEYQFFELPKLGDREISRSDPAARKWLLEKMK
jgi:predicted transposase/invertase (TIGR01784 family)